MNDNNQPLTKSDLEESMINFQESIVGGMNQMLTTLVNHMDKRFGQVDERFDRLERKVDNITDNHEVRISKLEQAKTA